ncbi:DUF1214 domain-containing protein [Sphingobium estronivorans]|uniref:DUF1214 domain-containing protein n=1 Tax=Sphingobium estronivorans TaxID=1577690 RepID=UPI0013C2D242|nr:DUF1214 domain-containing protein [Sphingobium estronivorans]
MSAPSAAAVRQNATTLGTPTQIEREAMALRVLETAQVQNELKRVEALYAVDPQGATATGKATIQRAAHSITMAAIYMAIAEDVSRPYAFWSVNAPHTWFGLTVPRSGYGIDNPDNIYRPVRLEGGARYEIHGKVRQPGPIELHLELRDSVPGTGAMAAEGGKQLATLRSDQIIFAPDGSFIITIDSDPANGRSNHMQMPPQGSFHMSIRQLLTDWATQNSIALDVRRVGGPAAGPPPSEDPIARRAVDFLSRIAPYWLAYDNHYVFTKPANQIDAPRARPGGRGFSSGGHFALADDQAWIITLSPLGAASMGFQLTDPWGVAYDYVDRTSSLNHTQAKPNADGSYSFVISKKDPGVYNWLDPEDHAAGMFAVRWQALPAAARPEDAVRGSKVVALDQLKRELPAGTLFVTPAQRDAQRAERARNYARRLSE